MDYILEVNNLTKTYDNFKLNNINFGVRPGTIMGFIGENGAGKSTTIKTILNLIKKDNGSIRILGKDHIKEEKKIKQDIGVVFDECYFHDTLNPTDVNIFMSKVFANWDSKQYFHYLDYFQLPHKKLVKELSRGMKMKLSIAVSLSHKAKLLILDEPTSGLDPIVRNEILDVFLEYIQDEGNSILMSSHITTDLERIADYITFIHEGNIILSDSKDDIIYNHGIIKCGEKDFKIIEPNDIKGYRKSNFGYEILINNRLKCHSKYPNLIIDNTTLEDVMLFNVKGEQAC